MICADCICSLGERLAQIESEPGSAPIHYFVAGQECVFCEKILATATFSLRRWIFGVCDACAGGLTARSVKYRGVLGQSYEF
jgi:hypothetical protein